MSSVALTPQQEPASPPPATADEATTPCKKGEATSAIRGVPLEQQPFTQASQTPGDSKAI